MKILAIANQKGGVGKSTLVVNLGETLMRRGKRVLFVDLDPQCNTTSEFGADTSEGVPTAYDLFEDDATLDEVIQHTERGDILPSDPTMAGSEAHFQATPPGLMTLRSVLSGNEDYDYVIVDTPPNLGLYLGTALVAADGVIIPIIAQKFAIDGLVALTETVDKYVKSYNPGLQKVGIVITNYDRRRSLDRTTENNLEDAGEQLGCPAFESKIRVCQDIAEALANEIPLYEQNPSCNGIKDYEKFTDELLERLGDE